MLADLFTKYGTDKGQLGYAPIYEILFRHRREQIKTVLEVGIGTLIPGVHSTMVGFGLEGYRPGGSLRAWRDYFNHAQIFGMDVQPDTQFSEACIFTMLCDSTNRVEVGGSLFGKNFDVIIDDGSHAYEDQVATLRNLWPFLNPAGLYIVEDITGNEWQKSHCMMGEGPFFFVKPKDAALLVIAKI